MGDKKSFILYQDWYNILSTLSQEEKGDILDAIFQYSGDGVKITLSPVENMAFMFIKQSLDRDGERWEDIKKARSDAGKLGGLAKASKSSKAKQRLANLAVSVTDTVTVTGNVTVSDNVTYSENKELHKAISEWIEYKKERKEGYKPMGLKSFISQCHSYTPASVIEQMRRSMSSGWKGVVWDNCTPIPKFDTKYDFSTMTETEAFEIIKNNRKLVPQLEYQNPVAFKGVKFALNTLQEYGC